MQLLLHQPAPNHPKMQGKCKHVYTITCKESGRIYVSQSANPQKRFKHHALKPPKKMFIDVNNYKPFVDCFELNVVFSSYRKYLCDRKKRRLISDLKTTQISCGYNILKGHSTSDSQY